MAKKFLECSIDELTTIKDCAGFAFEVQMLEYRLRKNEHLKNKSLLLYMPNLHDQMVKASYNNSYSKPIMNACGFFEIKELLEKLMNKYGVKENEVVIA